MSGFEIAKARGRRGRRRLETLRARRDQVVSPTVWAAASQIVDRVRRRGDRALLREVARHDGVKVGSVADLRWRSEPVTPDDRRLPAGFVEGLERSIAAVERYHRPQVREGYRLEESGMRLEERRLPLERVGIYVPGGRASYPSTAVMTVIPARLAGVSEIVVATPRAALESSPALRYALQRLEVEEVWGMGGAQAVAALALGTGTIRRVDKIVGPGNAWVTAAKQIVAGAVGVDGLAGPTEVVILATDEAPPALVAVDLLAQAEHDPLAAAVLVTPSRALARAVAAEIGRQLGPLSTRETAAASLARFGTAFLVRDLEEAEELVQEIAPEHLQLVGEGAEARADRLWRAGAVFVGAGTPEVFGDYVAGPSHVLPTCGSARFASALGVDDFVRRSHTIRCEPGAASRWAAAAVAMAEAEGLPAHAAAAQRRLR